MEPDRPVLRVMEQSTASGVAVTVQGELDYATADQLAGRLAHLPERNLPVTIDLRRVSFLDCAGLHVLLDVHAEGVAHGCPVEFIQGPPAVRRLFELTGTLEALPFTSLAPPAPVSSTG
jgi:anti-anti-sigma factor